MCPEYAYAKNQKNARKNQFVPFSLPNALVSF